MAMSRSFRCFTRILNQTPNYNLRYPSYVFACDYGTEENTTGTEKRSTGGFAQAFEKYTKTINENEVIKEESFATLFRKSKFIDMGDPEGKTVIGTIFHVVNDDLYIDFGWKFYCVCPRPQKNESDYVRGSKVRLSIKDLELSTKFLGSDKDLTILEADAILIGLVSSPTRSRPDSKIVSEAISSSS